VALPPHRTDRTAPTAPHRTAPASHARVGKRKRHRRWGAAGFGSRTTPL